MANEDLKVKIVDLSNEIETLRDGIHKSEEARVKSVKQIEGYKKEMLDTLDYLIESEDSDKVKINRVIADLGCKLNYQLNHNPLKQIHIELGKE